MPPAKIDSRYGRVEVKEEGAEDGSGVSTEPAGNPEPDQSEQLAGKVSSHEDQKEHLDSLRSPPGGMSI